MMMDENLVGYLLKSLDRDSAQEVEDFLRANPLALRRLDLLRQALQPLAADREAPVPPAGLWVRTLARIAEERSFRLLTVPKAPPVRPMAPARHSWWRRADALVAASLLFILVPLIPPALTNLRYHRNVVACQNNLRSLHQALLSYSNMHEGALPKVDGKPPRNYAGIFVPILRQSGFQVHVRCPANNHPPPEPVSLETLEQEYALGSPLFGEHVRQLSGCYAYPLGYRGPDGRHLGFRIQRGEANDRRSILADRPPFEQKDTTGSFAGNSRNHEGKGQNVLFMGGHVMFAKKRDEVGVGGKDIYLNIHHRPEAGLNPNDTVLGASGFTPYPDENP